LCSVNHHKEFMTRYSIVMNDIFARRGISLDRLHSFLSVAEVGSISLAAPGNPTTQSQLSRQIGELETFFGAALIERHGKGLKLTTAGAELAVVVREMTARLADYAANISEEPIEVTIGAGDSVIQWWITPNKKAFGRARLQLEMLSSPEVVDGLLDAKLDFGVIHASDLRTGLKSRPLGTIDYALYVSKQLLPKARGLGVKELLQQVPIGILNGEPNFSARLDAALALAGVRITPELTYNTFPQLCGAVAAGQCAAVLPMIVRDRLPPSGFHEYRDAILGKHDTKMSLAWTQRLLRQRPRVAAMIPAIADALKR
jgi:LysR family nitrogen assimilation transcriptional regulator